MEVRRGEPLHPYLESFYAEAKARPGMMLRLVDVESALGHLRCAPSEQLVLEADDGIPENAGKYTLGGGGVTRGAEVRRNTFLGAAAVEVPAFAEKWPIWSIQISQTVS